MRVFLHSYRGKHVPKEGDTEVQEVELTSSELRDGGGFLTIRLSGTVATVKVTELQSALRAFDDE